MRVLGHRGENLRRTVSARPAPRLAVWTHKHALGVDKRAHCDTPDAHDKAQRRTDEHAPAPPQHPDVHHSVAAGIQFFLVVACTVVAKVASARRAADPAGRGRGERGGDVGMLQRRGRDDVGRRGGRNPEGAVPTTVCSF